MSLRLYDIQAAIGHLASGTNRIRRLYASLLYRLSLRENGSADPLGTPEEAERLLEKAMGKTDTLNPAFEKYRTCHYCERGRYMHVGPNEKCLFGPTNFEPATVEDGIRWAMRDRPWLQK